MCETKYEYQEFLPRTIGGPSGNYELMAEVTSAEFVEFCVLSVAGGDAGPYTIIISGNLQPSTLLLTGASAFGTTSQGVNSQSVIDGIVLHSPGISSVPFANRWIRVVNQQRKVFARIDTPANTSAFVTIQFRDCILKRVPKPFVTVHPSDEAQYGHMRARRIEAAVLGKEGELETFGKVPGMPGTTREIETGETIIKGAQRMFKGRGQ